MNLISNKRAITFLGAVLLLVVHVAAQDKPDKKLEQAIAVLRRVDQGKLSEQQQKTKAKEIDAAWEVIKAASKTGVARLKEEIRLNRTNQHWDTRRYGTGSSSDRAPTATGRFRWNPVASAPGTVPMLLGSI
jgi:hypothetical protein